MLRSALAHLKGNRKIVVFIIDGGIKECNKYKILKSIDLEQCDIKWLQPPDSLFERVKVSGHVTVAAYFRLIIPELLPHQFRKVIYLDSDLIVNQDLSHLWDVEIGENYLLAVQDVMIPYVSSQEGLVNYIELGIPPSYKYFNSGVLVLNLEKWRTNDISTRVIEYLEQRVCELVGSGRTKRGTCG